MTRSILALASQYGRYGYRRISVLLREAGWQVGKDRVERIWSREGLKVRQKRKPRGRLWLNDGWCVRLRPERPNHVWSDGFVSTYTHDGRTVRMLNLGLFTLSQSLEDEGEVDESEKHDFEFLETRKDAAEAFRRRNRRSTWFRFL